MDEGKAREEDAPVPRGHADTQRETGGSDTADAPLSSEASDPALQRSVAVLFLIGGVCSTAFALTELATGHFRDIGASYLWVVLAAVASWLAFALRGRGYHRAWAATMAACAINANAAMVDDLSSAVVMTGVLVILVWSGLLLRPRLNSLLAAYALVALWVGGADFVLSTSDMGQSPGLFPLALLLTFVAVPLGLGVIVHQRQQAARASLDRTIAELRAEEHRLVAQLERKKGELERSHEQLFEAQKLKNVGTMASGLAHELNNILTPIRGHAELIAEGAASPDKARAYGQRILDSAAAAAQITGALLTYTRQGTFQPVRSNLRQLLQNQIFPVLSGSLPNNIQLRIDNLPRNVSVDVDRVLFQQAIANLVFNAVDAMPDGGEITIGLTTSGEPPSDSDDDPHPQDSQTRTGEAALRSAVVTVTDNGTGIDQQHLDHIFDPFFTTKAVGSGSGLGLAMVMGTVTRHGGRVTVDSTLGEGTTFTLFLPLVSDDASSDKRPWPVLEHYGKGPIVVVLSEDQDTLDEFEELLQATECAPICTSEPDSTRAMLANVGNQVDLLILDLELDTVDAKRLFKRTREQFPEMPAILLSDQPTDPTVQRMLGAGPTRSVRKPMDGRLFSALLTDLLQPGDSHVREFTPVPINPGADVSGPHPRAG